MTKSTVLVLGANGRLGDAAVHAFCDAGWRVLAQARRAPSKTLPAGAQGLSLPLDDVAGLAKAAQGASTVIYAVNPAYTDWDSQLLPLARHGMAIAQQLAASFMLPGNVYNYGEEMPSVLTEQTAQRPSNRKGELRRQLEREISDRAPEGLRGIVLRAGDFYGGGSGSWMDQLIVKDLERGKLAYPGPMDVPHAWAYLPDLARAFVALASRAENLRAKSLATLNEAGAETLRMGRAGLEKGRFESFGFEGHTFTGHELLRHIEDAAGALDVQGSPAAQGFRVGGMPWALIRIVGTVYPLWRELARMSYLWRVSHRLDGRALEQTIGPLMSTEPKQAMRGTLLALGFGKL